VQTSCASTGTGPPASDSLYRAAHDLDLLAPRGLDLINASLDTFRHHEGRWQMLAWGDRTHLENITVFQEG